MITQNFRDYAAAALVAMSLVVPGCAKKASDVVPSQNQPSPIHGLYNVRQGIDRILFDYDKTILVVGDQAPSSDVLCGVDIASRLQSEHTALTGSAQGLAAKLASEVGSSTYNQNMIVIGKEQDNPLADLLRSSLSVQDRPLPSTGTGVIECYQFSNGNVAIVVTAQDSSDIRKAGRAVAQYDHVVNGQPIDLNGRVIHVQGTSLNDVQTTVQQP